MVILQLHGIKWQNLAFIAYITLGTIADYVAWCVKYIALALYVTWNCVASYQIYVCFDIPIMHIACISIYALPEMP